MQAGQRQARLAAVIEEPRPVSDVDVLVVLESAPRARFARREMLVPVLERLDAEIERLAARGIYTDVVPVVRSRADATRTQPYYLDMVEEAILLHDRDGFFAGVLAQLRRRLAELGAQRLCLGRVKYWDLKPDLRPGEDIEL